MEKDNLFMSAEDIARVTGMSEQYAYKLIKQLNLSLIHIFYDRQP